MAELEKKHILRNHLIELNIAHLQNKKFLEFGVYRGESMLNFYDIYNKNNINSIFYGFDSWEGLPQELIDPHNPTGWRPEKFSTNGYVNPNLLNKPNVYLIDGWFSDTLTEELAQTLGKKSVGLVHMDCDIYTSTIQCLEFLVKYDLLADDAFIIYDDWGAYLTVQGVEEWEVGEAKAHKEITEKYNLNFELISKTIIDPSFYEITIWKLCK